MSITVVGSPPYADGCGQNGHDYHPERMKGPRTGYLQKDADDYGTTPGQLGALPSGVLDASAQPTSPVPVTTWQGCYGDSWQDLIVPEAFAHPAKFARGLIHRIYRHMLEQGYVRQGEVILDPFGGVALGALDAMTYGLRYVGIELESRFVALGQQNLELWRQRYGFTGGTLVQGDSRQLRSVLGGAQVGCCVSSPPYVGIINEGTGQGIDHAKLTGNKPGPHSQVVASHYGTSPGQLGAMPPGVVVSSPPFSQPSCQPPNVPGAGGRMSGPPVRSRWHEAADRPQALGTTPGQLGAMPPGTVQAVVGSPPWHNSQEGASVAGPSSGMWKGYEKGFRPTETGPIYASSHEHYGSSPGQLGAMPPGVVVSSPPYAESDQNYASSWTRVDRSKGLPQTQKRGLNANSQLGASYGTTPAQLGNTAGDTFWSAAAQIMTELASILPPGAVCAWVLKSYVSKGKIVPFPQQWLALCEQHGFVLVEEIHASLVEDHGTQEGLFGESTKVTTEKKSFFRRLAEKKGSPRIDHETVLIVRKAGDGGGVCCVSSPPWTDTLDVDHGSFHPYSGDRANQRPRSPHAAMRRSQDYGATHGNLGNLPVGMCCVSSPPFSVPGNQPPNMRAHAPVRKKWASEPDRPDTYGTTPGNLGNMAVGMCCVSSPPYSGSHVDGEDNPYAFSPRLGDTRTSAAHGKGGNYGTTPGNLGNLPVGRR